MQVRTMMQQALVTVTPDTSLAQAQRLMRDRHIRHLPVVSGTRLLGIVTDRDIRDAIPSPATTLSRGEIAYQLDTTSIQNCMSQEVVTVTPDTDIVSAARLLLEHKFGCLPVVRGQQLVGIVTDTDFLWAFLKLATT